MAKITKEEALKYHSDFRPGKIEVIPTKPHSTQRDLALAYTPGVADPCLEIEKTPEDVYKYTAKGNLVAVISNGTAVLGLGDLGAEAGKPVMEGKGLLFKIFADIDVFDIEVTTKDIDIFVETVKQISPTFGGINLEDIKAPECFEIERRLKEELNIPVMHDDQHGTAIISSAGLLNAVEIAGKKFEEVKMVVSGAGAAAMACTRLIVSLGVKKENIIMCDTKGVLNKKRTDLNKYKMDFVTSRDVNTLEEALKGADIFFGLSAKDLVSKEMVKSMAKNPIIFAMANPDPEITYEDALAAREDVIMATGRSDYPNQVNNVLGFPFIFRGALDVRATTINEEMKKAAVYALAALAKENVPEEVNIAYQTRNLQFGRTYIIPKPLDPRLIVHVASAVAKAAMDSGVALKPIKDWDAYRESLMNRIGSGNKLIRKIYDIAKSAPKRVLFGEAENYNVLRAAQISMSEGFAIPILLGNEAEIRKTIAEYQLDELKKVEIIDSKSDSQNERREKFAQILYKSRARKGLTLFEAREKVFIKDYFGALLVEEKHVDAFITGYSTQYSEALKPIVEVVKCTENIEHLAGMYIMLTKKGPFFFADTTVNRDPDTNTLVNTTVLTAETLKKMNIDPKIALVSYSNFGSTRTGTPAKVSEAVKILHEKHPDLAVEGEMQANFALNPEIRKKKYPFAKMQDQNINTLIFPNLSSGNIAYKMMQEIGDSEAIGPVLMGIKRPIHIIQLEASVREIVNMTAIAVVDAQAMSSKK
jgi:malate dehydrogenase (oxaloacetate-decarboxylating)(NADP+)